MEEAIKNILQNSDRIVTVVLAVWSAILSTILFLSDKPKIKVGMAHGFQIGGLNHMDSAITFSAVNYGRRPVTISNFTIKTSDNQYLFTMPNLFIKHELPVKLEENDDTSIIISYETLLNSVKENQTALKSVIFTDNVGKKYEKKFDKKLFSELTKR